MPPASGSGGGGDVWGPLLSGILDGVTQKLNQKAGGSTPKQTTGSSPSKPAGNPSGEGAMGAALSQSLGTILSQLMGTSGGAPSSPRPTPSQDDPIVVPRWNPPKTPPPGSNAQQQTVPPLTSQMNQTLNSVNAKLNASAAPQAPSASGRAAPATAGGGAASPPSQPPQPAASSSGPPPNQPSGQQDSRLKQVLDGIASILKSPMVSARKGLEYLNRAVDNPDEMIERGRMRGGIGGSLESATGHGIRGLQRDRPLQGIGDMMGGAGEVTGGPVRSFFKLNEILLKTVDRLRTWNDRLHEGNIRFAEFSGSMFAVQQQSQNRQDILDMQKGEALAPSAKELAETKDKLNQRLFKLDVGWQWLQNKVGSLAGKGLDKIAGLDPTGLLSGPNVPPGQTMHDWMRQVTEDEAKRPGSLIPRPNRWGSV